MAMAMVLTPVASEAWRGSYVPLLASIAADRGIGAVELLLLHGVEWKVIAELRGELPLRDSTASTVGFIVDSLLRGEHRAPRTVGSAP